MSNQTAPPLPVIPDQGWQLVAVDDDHQPVGGDYGDALRATLYAMLDGLDILDVLTACTDIDTALRDALGRVAEVRSHANYVGKTTLGPRVFGALSAQHPYTVTRLAARHRDDADVPGAPMLYRDAVGLLRTVDKAMKTLTP